MARPLVQLRALAEKLKVPIVCAGDLFHKWNSPPELINFAIKHLPKMYCIPGQHDLPLHSYADIRKSAYWTLVEAGVITDIPGGGFLDVPEHRLRLFGFPWGFPVTPCEDRREGWFHLAVVHAYCWSATTGYPGAAPEHHARHHFKSLEGYDGGVYGDNHKGALYNEKGLLRDPI
jgi:hypothetical protein